MEKLAPVFTPTEEAFSDPLAYISSLREAAEPCGICRIVPPAGWKPPFCLDPEKVKFRTRAQVVNHLGGRRGDTREEQIFWADFGRFNQGMGRPLPRNPILGGREVDLCRLCKAVCVRGGYDRVTADRQWRDVARAIQVHLMNGNTCYSLRTLYQKHLVDFERHLVSEGGASSSSSPSPPRVAHRPEGSMDELCRAAVQAAAQAGIRLPEREAEGRGSRALERDRRGRFKRPGLASGGEAGGEIGARGGKRGRRGRIRGPRVASGECDGDIEAVEALLVLGAAAEGLPRAKRAKAGGRPKGQRARGGGVRNGPELTMAEFCEMARAFERNYWGSHEAARRVSLNPLGLKERRDVAARVAGLRRRPDAAGNVARADVGATWRMATPQKIEDEFWTVVEKGKELVEVINGADIDTKANGSGFPRDDSNHGSHPWNLNNLSKNPNNLLKHISRDVPGVVVPWVYVGMQFSSFCWHAEDHMFYSINYLHWGAPKRWYAVPSNAARKLEEALKAHLPKEFDTCPDMLFKFVTMMDPRVLRKHGVPVYETTQEEGHFVVTFPNAHHAGFNLGLNCAEAINFAPLDWLRFGKASCEQYRSLRQRGVIGHEELLLQAANELQGANASPLLQSEINRVVSSEALFRHRHWAHGLRKFAKIESAVGLKKGDREDALCSICHQYLHLSAVACSSCPGRHACLHHVSELCGCDITNYTLLYRHSLLQLEQISDSVRLERAEAHGCVSKETEDEMSVNVEILPAITVQQMAQIHANGPLLAADMEPRDDEQKIRDVLDKVCREGVARAQKMRDVLDKVCRERVLKGVGVLDESIKVEDAAFGVVGPASQACRDMAARNSAIEPQKPALQVCRDTAARNWAEESEDPVAVKLSVHPEGGKGRKRNRNGDALMNADTMATFRERKMMASFQGFLETWKQRAKGVLKDGLSRLAENDALLAEAEQFLWGGSEVGDARALHKELLTVQDWVATLKRCSGPRVRLEDLEKIVNWESPPAHFSNLEALRSLCEAARAWVAECKEQGSRPMTVEAIQAMIAKGKTLKVLLPRLSNLEWRLKNALEIRASAQKTLDLGPIGDAVQDESTSLSALQSRAVNYCLAIPELDAIRARMETVQTWQDKAVEMMEMATPLHTLKELLEEARRAKIRKPQVGQLRGLIKRAEEWAGLATAALEDEVPSKKLRHVLQSGLRLGVAMEQVEQIRGMLRRRDWEDTTKCALTNYQTVASLRNVLADAASFEAKDSEVYAALCKRLQEAEEWDEHFGAVLKTVDDESVPEDGKPSLDDLVAMMKEVSKLNMRLENMQRIGGLIKKCKSLKSRAASMAIRMGAPFPPPLQSALTIFEEAKDLNVRITFPAGLIAGVEETAAWCERARTLIEKWPTEPVGTALRELCVETQGLLFKTDEQAELVVLDARIRAQALIGALFVDDVSVEVPHGWDQDLMPLDIEYISPLMPLKELFSDEVQKQSARERVALPDRPSMEAGKALLRVAEEVGVPDSTRSDVAKIVQTAEDVDGQIKQVLQAPCHLGEALADKTVQELVALLGKALQLPFWLEGIAELEDLIKRRKAWEDRTRQVDAPLPWSTTAGLIQELRRDASSAGKDGEIPCSDVHRLEAFMEQLTCDLAPAGAGKIGPAMEHLISSVRNVYWMAVRVSLTCIYHDFADTGCERNGHNTPTLSDHCICFQPRGEETVLSCNECGDWFHSKCIGVADGQNEVSEARWTCPLCQAIRGNLEGTVECIKHFQKTARPCLSKLEALMQQAVGLKLPEEGQLAETIFLFNSWQDRVLSLLDNRSKSVSLPEAALRSILKAVLHVEVDASWMLDRIIETARSEKWRKKVVAAHKNSHKPTIDSLQCLLDDSRALQINPSKDAAAASIHESVSQGLQWMERAGYLQDRLRRRSGEPINDANTELLHRVRAHLASVEHMRCRVDGAVLDSLREVSSPHCTCETVYDGKRSMVVCTVCGRWFHCECVGLKSALLGERPGDFRCPRCCEATAQPYPHSLPVDNAKAGAGQECHLAPNHTGRILDEKPNHGLASGERDQCSIDTAGIAANLDEPRFVTALTAADNENRLVVMPEYVNGLARQYSQGPVGTDPGPPSTQNGSGTLEQEQLHKQSNRTTAVSGANQGGPLPAGTIDGCSGMQGNGRPPGIGATEIAQLMVALSVPSAGGLAMSAEEQLRVLGTLRQMITNKMEELEQELCSNGKQ
eukprot:evm.model.scf_1.21 EVM.evm.TU.scf_1.21   scf_1:357513-369896(+)